MGFFTKKYINITKKELDLFLKDKHNYQFLDVRTKAEYRLQKIKGFNINLDFHQFRRNPSMLAHLKKDKPIIVTCQSGARSMASCRILYRLGFKEIYNLRGGVSRNLY